MTKAQKQEQAEAIARLRGKLMPGDTVECILRHVSRSGMFRVIDAVIIRDGIPESIGPDVAKAIGFGFDRDRWGIKVSGCGMDMGFHVVYALSHALWQDGYGCTGEGCGSNDHSNGDRDYTPHKAERPTDETGKHTFPVAHWHSDGGYALAKRWL